ncbi:MAG: ABC transporter substrate-binding protein [Rhodospirillaceae bacterium]|nr:ABC transporter substrate-binding protein [Rhodospirillaceae bacterium]
MAERTLSVIVFPGGLNLPLWAGMAEGFFARRGLALKLHHTGGSMEQLAGLVRGDWDIGLTGFDNIVAYQEGQGEAAIDRAPDLFAFMGGDDAFLRLVVQKDIASYADLRGKTLSVDALTTGFAFVLRKMLALNGLAEGDVNFERAGGVLQRWEALKAGKHAGTLLITPFELIAEKMGLRLLQSAQGAFPRYQGLVGAARRGWAAANGDALAGFVRGYVDSLAWLFDRKNEPAACALLVEKVPNMSPELAAATYEIFCGEKGGFEPRARIDREGMKVVLALRSEFGRPQKTLADPDKYLDLSYYEKALALA